MREIIITAGVQKERQGQVERSMRKEGSGPLGFSLTNGNPVIVKVFHPPLKDPEMDFGNDREGNISGSPVRLHASNAEMTGVT